MGADKCYKDMHLLCANYLRAVVQFVLAVLKWNYGVPVPYLFLPVHATMNT